MAEGPTPHRCPKCDGKSWLQYDPQMPFGKSWLRYDLQMPFGNTTSAGPWKCPVCINGIIWSQPMPTYPIPPAIGDNT